MTFATAAFAVPDVLLLELELLIATPPIETATAAAPAATNFVSLREDIETTPIRSIENAPSLASRDRAPPWGAPPRGPDFRGVIALQATNRVEQLTLDASGVHDRA